MPLHVARDLSSAKLLLASGADINARDRNGNTLLHIAASTANARIIAVLLVNGADVNAKDSTGRTPAALADTDTSRRAYSMGWRAYADMAQIGVDENMFYHVRDVSPKDFEEAIRTGDTDTVEKGLPEFDVSQNDQWDGNTLLHIAARHNQSEIAQLLLDNGAGINTKNNFGNTPLHTAANHWSTEVVELLLSRGANVNAQDNDGDTPLHQAIFHLVDTEIVKMLLSKANVNVRNKQGRRPVDLSTNEEIRRELEVIRRQRGV